MALKTSDYDYALPEELIAQTPTKDRLACRLLALNARTGAYQDDIFAHLDTYLEAGDVLVLNDTRVLPARLYGVKEETGGHCEVLLLKPVPGAETRYETLVKPGRRIHEGQRLSFGEGRLIGTVEKELAHGGRIIRFDYDGIFMEILEALGEMPLPPYIKEKLADSERYQTVYARENGSAAAPTAGLHFTDEYLEKLQQKGIKIAMLTLHVGLGTFRPVSAEDLTDHQMHAEYYHIEEEACRLINEAKANGHRVVACGTTVVRTLETIGQNMTAAGQVEPERGWTDIFIYPGFTFKVVDAIITNFHLPQSTLVMLVSAFAGRENILRAYQHAVEEQYRFFSFGDAMFMYRA